MLEIRGIYPTPFNEVCSIYCFLRKPATVKAMVYDVAGEPVRTWSETFTAPGKIVLEWKGDNDSGARCSFGAFILRLSTEAADGDTDLDWGRLAISR